jgi:hypothetical protein
MRGRRESKSPNERPHRAQNKTKNKKSNSQSKRPHRRAKNERGKGAIQEVLGKVDASEVDIRNLLKNFFAVNEQTRFFVVIAVE